MPTLRLEIEALAGEPGWSGAWSMDGDAASETLRVAGEAAASLARLSQRFQDLFAGELRPFADPAALRAFGAEIERLWIAPAWASLGPRVGATAENALVIQSADGAVLDLPWELVELQPDLPLGCDAAWTLRRLPGATSPAAAAAAKLAPGPLRVLFLAAAPVDQPQLDFEREEDLMLRATQLPGGVAIQIAETGTLAELAQLAARCRPHIVHLSGHGDVDDMGRGFFVFEDEDGQSDPRDAVEIAAELTRGGTVRCMVLNGCKTSQATSAGLARALVAAGLPLALGWAQSVDDSLAIRFAEAFYGRLVAGEPVAQAAAHARKAIRDAGRYRHQDSVLQDATFSLPQLYGTATGGEVYDRSAPLESYAGPRTEYALLGDGIKGLREGFVGRRRDVQKLLPPLRRGDAIMAVVTGIGGGGKSTLATRAANRLAVEGFRVVPVRVPPAGSPAEAARRMVSRIIDALERALVREDRADLQGVLTGEKVREEQRLRIVVEGLNELRLLLVLDNFEDVLDLETRRIADPILQLLYRSLAGDLTRGSRVIVTSRYLPDEEVSALHLPLADFKPHDVRKFLLRDRRVEERLHRGEIPIALVDRFCSELGGTPGFLNTARNLLAVASPEGLLEELEGEIDGALTAEREAFYRQLFTARLYAALSLEARSLTSRLAASELPLPGDGIERITGFDASRVAACLDQGVAYGLVQPFLEEDLPTLYHPPGLLRPWLAAPERLPQAEAQATHHALAAFWKESYEQDRERELRVPIEVELEACRRHARLAADSATLRWATVRRVAILDRRAEWRSAKEILQEIPPAARDTESLGWLARVHADLGERKWARALLEEALSIADKGSIDEARALHSLADLDIHESDYRQAERRLRLALESYQAKGELRDQAAIWHELATIDLNQGNYTAASSNFERSLKIKQEIGDHDGAAATLHQLAILAVQQSNFPSARALAELSLKVWQQVGDRSREAAGWHLLASIDLKENKYVDARTRLERSLKIRQEIGARAREAATLHQLASIDLKESKYADARGRFERSLVIVQEIGDRAGEAAAFFQIGVLAERTGHGDLGAQLTAICWLIDDAIGHGDRQQDFENLTALCRRLGYDQERFDAMVEAARTAYAQDRGQELVRRVLTE